MQDYSTIAARWWVEQILEIIPSEAFWGKFDAMKALAISQFIDNIVNRQKEMYINSLAKKLKDIWRMKINCR